MDRPDLDQPFLIARIEHVHVAIPSGWASEMIVCPDASPLPAAPAAVRGVGIRRGRTVTMFDARLLLGLPSRASETAQTIELLVAREQDHIRWVDTLLECIDTGRPFALSRDPSGCAFGRWYDQYEAPTVMLRHHMAKFDEPHRAVHALAEEAEALAKSQGAAAAHERIMLFKAETLARMLQLFEEARRLMREDLRELLVINDDGARWNGLIVDEVESVERLRADTLEPLTGRVPGADESLVPWCARTQKDVVVLLPDMDALLGHLAVA